MILTDKYFFDNVINYSYPGLEEMQILAASGKYSECRRFLADFFRKLLKPDLYFSTQRELRYSEKLISEAEKACRHYMVSVRIPMDFKGEKVDWFANPTLNGYKEWTWQLNRHNELVNLARAYLVSKEERYIEASAELLNSWFEQADAPKIGTSGYDTLCWRTIECGIRAGWTWPIVINTFVPVWDDDTVCNLCKSIYEHGIRLRNDYTANNWLIMEMNGLCHIGLFFPFLKDADEWYGFAMDLLNAELSAQIYPDKAHYEITPNYQRVIIINYLLTIKTARAYGKQVPDTMLKSIEKAVEYYIHMMTPSRRLISTNDGNEYERPHVPELIAEYVECFPDNKMFKWLYGKPGGIEPCKDYIFNYAGNATLRTDWSENAVMLFFDGGVFGKGHQHEDKLSVVLCADGKEILVDAGGYAYDDSPMRKYVLESASHNTVLVDGKGQNRRKNYEWKPEDIKKKSDLKYMLSEKVDFLWSFYNEGYGDDKENIARHERSVFFVKKLGELRPFVIVTDRLYSLDAKEHCYDVMWHIDVDCISISGLDVRADNLRILVGNEEAEETALEVCRGRKFPSMKGWTADSMKQGDYRPIYTATYKVTGKNVRHITVLYPDGGNKSGICKVTGSNKIADNEICIFTDTGNKYTFNEDKYSIQ